MADRINGLTVILDKTMRIDDAEIIINAISMIKNVQQVLPIAVKLPPYRI